MRLADVLTPAIGYARNGYPLVERICATIGTVEATVPRALADLRRGLSAERQAADARRRCSPIRRSPTPTSASCARPRAPAATARPQIERARKAWSQGLRRRGDRPLLPHAGGDGYLGPPASRRAHRRRHGGLAGDRRGADRATITAATRCCNAGAWTPGAGRPCSSSRSCKGFDLDGLDPAGPDFIHSRSRRRSSPSPTAIPSTATRNSSTCRSRRCSPTPTTPSARKLIGNRASLELRPGTIAGYGKAIDARAAEGGAPRSAPTGAGEPTVGRIWTQTTRTIRRWRGTAPESLPIARATCSPPAPARCRGDTVHFDIIDRDGNMISAHAVGRLAAILAGDPGARLLPRHAGAEFWLDEDHPAALRARQAAALDPRRRRWRCATASPTSPGARPAATSRTSGSPQFFLRHVHAGMNLQEAIDAPAWHTEHFPSSFWPRTSRPGVVVVEGRVPKATVDELRRRGHIVEVGERLVRGPPDRGFARRHAPQGRRQSARHARLCGGAVGGDLVDHRAGRGDGRDRHRGRRRNSSPSGARVPRIEAGVGAVATQALIEPALRPARPRAAAARRAGRRGRCACSTAADAGRDAPAAARDGRERALRRLYRRGMRRLVRPPASATRSPSPATCWPGRR